MTQWILTSSLLIVVVLLIRKIVGDKLSARVRYALWGLVLLRLLIPVSIGESALSVQNWLPEEEEYAQVQTEPVLIKDIIETMESAESTQPTGLIIAETENTRTYVEWPVVVWLAGMVVVALVFLLSNLRFWLRLRRSRVYVTKQTLPVYATAAIESPCMYGLLRPAVYVTPEVLKDEKAQRYVLAHELTHYRHGDHIWSFLRCLAVILHWYNPLVWTASFASQQDGELACDEGALRRIGEENRREYARTLIDLTCVGYGGMLTTATSMTGRKCDLRNRVVRISKNPKMTVTALIVVLLIAAVFAVMLFTGATAPAIEGVWGLEMDVLGEGVPEGATACVVYEFSDGNGRYALYMEEGLRIARKFTYTLSDNIVTITYSDTGEVEEHTWTVEDKTLTFGGGKRAAHYTAREVKSVPYLPDDYWVPVSVVADYPDGVLYSDLTDTQQAQLMELLRSGTVIGNYRIKRASKAPVDDAYHICWLSREQWPALEIAHGGVYVDRGNKNWIEFYELSNMAQIEAWISELDWYSEGSFNRNMETDGFVPSDMVGITEARLHLMGKAFYADPAQLAFLEELLSTAEDMGWVSACPFEGILEVTLSDGRVLGITLALDSCAVFMIGDRCYEYGNQFAYDDEGSYDNSALLAVFGLDYTDVEAMWQAAYEAQPGEVIGTMEDVGDVVRVMNDVMEPLHLTLSHEETLMSLLTEGIFEPVEEMAEVSCLETYYIILSAARYGFPDGVTVSDNGSVYMDGLRYEPNNIDEILELLKTAFGEFRITQRGEPLLALYEAVGSTVYLELGGMPENAEVVWTSEDETVCTVDGDVYGCTIHVVSGGVSNVTATWTGGGRSESETVTVFCDRTE